MRTRTRKTRKLIKEEQENEATRERIHENKGTSDKITKSSVGGFRTFPLREQDNKHKRTTTNTNRGQD